MSRRRWAASMLPFAALAMLAEAASGCAEVRATIAARQDYADYREVRLAVDEDHRLHAAMLYLARHPQGAFAPAVATYYLPRERDLYARGRLSLKAARAYLAALPDGPHADELADMVRQTERSLAEHRARVKADEDLARKRTDAARAAVTNAIAQWTKLAAASDAFGAPLALLFADAESPGKDAGPKSFAATFASTFPSPACTELRCDRSSAHAFPMIGSEPPRLRSLDVRVHVLAPAGRVATIEIDLGELGFSSWLEAAELRARSDDTRKEALTYAKNKLEALVRSGKSGCTVTDADATRTLMCPGLQVTIGVVGGRDVVRFDARP